ncbi:MAG: polysaccharide deacetylase family protein [Leptospirales bacterium]|nr:polysaccharide deacetylase family protein [Leptospirales bacterium]
MMSPSCLVSLLLLFALSFAPESVQADVLEMSNGAIVRGPTSKKKVALIFAGHHYAEGMQPLLAELARRNAKGSFFLTGDFLRNPHFKPLVVKAIREGHYVGPHSDKHLLCCREVDRRTLLSKSVFQADLRANLHEIQKLVAEERKGQGSNYVAGTRFYLPAFEVHNEETTSWSRELHLQTINYTPGTFSHADYTEDGRGFVSSQVILRSILQMERRPGGLNGFFLLLHTGAGPRRTDKMHARFGELLAELAYRGYSFVRIDQLIDAN